MNDILWVHVFDSLDNLSSDYWSRFFWEFPSNCQTFKQVPISSQLHEKVNSVLVEEKIVKLDQVRVFQIRLDLDLVH